MGASVATALLHKGHCVYWLPEGRGKKSHARAARLGLRSVEAIEEMGELCDFILCICPPQGAEAVAVQVAATGYSGLYLDANAISPQKALRIAKIVEGGGATFVDGGIIGPPVGQQAGVTTLFLAGEQAEAAARYFKGSPLATGVLSSEVGKASALKMCDSTFNKNLLAALFQAVAVAEHFGVRENLMAYWQQDPNCLGNVSTANGRLSKSATKAWRFIHEMAEVVDTFAACPTLGAGIPREARQIFAQIARLKPAEPPSEQQIVAALLTPDESGGGS